MATGMKMDFIVNKEDISVTIKREFDAGQELVWEAWTNPDILDQWWAPSPFTSKTRTMDFRAGGKRVYAMVNPANGEERWSLQAITSVCPITNFKFTAYFTDENENINPALAGSDWDLNFSENGGKTTVDILIRRNSLAELEQVIQMGFKEGFTAALENLDQYLESQSK